MRLSRLVPFAGLVLALPVFAASAASYSPPMSCPSAEELLRASIECSTGGGRASMVREGSCRRVTCAEQLVCSTTRTRQTRVQQLERSAYAGNTDAMLALGLMYYTGQGVSQSDVKAFAWLATADAQGADLPGRDEIDEYFATHMTEREVEQAYTLLQSIASRLRTPESTPASPKPTVTPPTTSQTSGGASRDALRRQDVAGLLSALAQYSIGHNGNFPTPVPTEPTEICAVSGASCRGMIDVAGIMGPDLPSIPRDPLTRAGEGTGYYIVREPSGRITVSAPQSETGLISVTR